MCPHACRDPKPEETRVEGRATRGWTGGLFCFVFDVAPGSLEKVIFVVPML